MAFVYEKKKLVDLFMNVWNGAFPEQPIARKKIVELIQEIKEDGEIVKSPEGEKNLTGAEILAGVAIGVLSSLVYDIAKYGAKKLFAKSDSEILKQVNPTRNAERRKASLAVIEYVRENEADKIEKDVQGTKRTGK
jgi:hypothetical protein